MLWHLRLQPGSSGRVYTTHLLPPMLPLSPPLSPPPPAAKDEDGSGERFSSVIAGVDVGDADGYYSGVSRVGRVRPLCCPPPPEPS